MRTAKVLPRFTLDDCRPANEPTKIPSPSSALSMEQSACSGKIQTSMVYRPLACKSYFFWQGKQAEEAGGQAGKTFWTLPNAGPGRRGEIVTGGPRGHQASSGAAMI